MLIKSPLYHYGLCSEVQAVRCLCSHTSFPLISVCVVHFPHPFHLSVFFYLKPVFKKNIIRSCFLHPIEQSLPLIEVSIPLM